MAVHEAIFVLCDRVKREAGTNKATLDGLFDRVMVTHFPGALNAYLYVRFFGATGTHAELKLVLNRPNGMKEVLPPFVFKSDPGGRVEGEIALQGVPLFGKGRHSFTLSWNGTIVGTVSFNVETTQVKDAGSGIPN